MKTLALWTPGRMEYGEAWEQQKRLHALRRDGKIPDTLILLEHPHVYTIGRHGNRTNILFDDHILKKKGIAVYEIDRGGDVTYHGPGQVVGYPVFCYRDLGFSTRRFVHSIEEVIIRYLNFLELEAFRDPQYPGVWTGRNKICAIGLRVKENVSMHGFALNVETDREFFNGIIACGIRDRGVSHLKEELEKKGKALPPRDEIYSGLTHFFCEKFGFDEIHPESGSTPFPGLSG